MTPPHLELRRLTKSFGDFRALDDVSMQVRVGSFHALLGENGAGKSTLVKCVIGYQGASSGSIALHGQEVSFRNTREAHRRGLGMVYQRFTLVENMSVAENLVLVRDEVPAVVDWKREHSELASFMERMPFRVPLKVPVHSLSAGEKQKLEILKQLYLKRSLLFLDEPTSVLTPSESDEVLSLLHGLTQQGALTVVMITHKFREVTGYADHVSILRRGALVASRPIAELDVPEMSRLMVGNATLRSPAPRALSTHSEPRLELEKLTALDDTGTPALRGLSLSVNAGEIVGIAGVSGNGQRELVEVICGQRRLRAGEVRVNGRSFSATREEFRGQRVFVVPEVPLDNGAVPAMSVSENLVLRDYDVPPILRGRWFVSRARIAQQAARAIEAFNVKAPSAESPIRDLSGGNIQRAVLARELASDAKLLIVANPCFGLDFATSAEIRARLVDARNRGAAVLLISEDLDELLELSDRLCVIFDGDIVFERAPRDTHPGEIGGYMAGHLAHEGGRQGTPSEAAQA
ncbi:MAG: ABC transporter ATP-binding protein [Myxococcales bacterium]